MHAIVFMIYMNSQLFRCCKIQCTNGAGILCALRVFLVDN